MKESRSRAIKEIKDQYHSLAEGYEQRWSRYHEIQIDWIVDRLEGLEGTIRAVVDLGCGTGLALDAVAKKFPAAELFGVDLSESMLSYAARRLPQATFLQGDLTDHELLAKLPQADLVLSLSVLHHLEDLDSYLAALKTNVHRNAAIFLSTFAREGMLMNLAELYFRVAHTFHVRSLSQRALRKVLVEQYRFLITDEAILRPDWFWQVQIYQLSIR